MSNTNTNNKTAQPMTACALVCAHLILRQTYTDERGHEIHVRQSGDIANVDEVAPHQKNNNVRKGEVNIPLKGYRLQRADNGELVVNKESDYTFVHPSVFHHGHRLTAWHWMVIVDGRVYKESDTKRNYNRRLRDLVNVCKRFGRMD